jgi:14-3-3 protein epsilon
MQLLRDNLTLWTSSEAENSAGQDAPKEEAAPEAPAAAEEPKAAE